MGDVLVIKDSDLNIRSRKSKFLQGDAVKNVLDTIFKKSFWHDRNMAEEDFSLRQIIVYTVFVQFDESEFIEKEKEDKIFFYRRDPGKNYDEKRLRNKWSCGLGGHISQEKDGVALPIINSMIRELREEVGIETSLKMFDPAGVIYGTKTEVDRVHLGILNIIDYGGDIKPVSKEIAEGRMMTISEIETLLSNPKNELESWSKVVFAYIKKQIWSRGPKKSRRSFPD